MMQHPERRAFTRTQVEVEAVVQFEEGGMVRGEVWDLSLNGAAIAGKVEAFSGQICTVQLILHGGSDPVHINAKARVVRAEQKAVVVEFTAIGPESLEHLERLVLMNAQDPGQVDEEIADALGIKRRSGE